MGFQKRKGRKNIWIKSKLTKDFVICCLALKGKDFCTGSSDGVIVFWTKPKKDKYIQKRSYKNHDGEIISMDANAKLDLIISSDRSSICLRHFSNYEFFTKIQCLRFFDIIFVRLSLTGYIVCLSINNKLENNQSILIYSINGYLVKLFNIDYLISKSIFLYENGESFILSDKNECIHIFDILLNHELKYSLRNFDQTLPIRYDTAIEKGIFGLSLYSDRSKEILIFGNAKGSVYCFSNIYQSEDLKDAVYSVFM